MSILNKLLQIKWIGKLEIVKRNNTFIHKQTIPHPPLPFNISAIKNANSSD
jgi:hypothetical protein